MADSFVRAEADVVTAPPVTTVAERPEEELAESPDVQPPGRLDIQPLRPGIVQRRSGRVRRRTTVYLEPSLSTRLAVYCATYGLEISQVAEAAILDHLNSLDRRSARPAQDSSAAG
jgi:hypothetical protein